MANESVMYDYDTNFLAHYFLTYEEERECNHTKTPREKQMLYDYLRHEL